MKTIERKPYTSDVAEREMTANEITAYLLLQIPKQFPGARVWRQNRLSAMAVGRGGKLRHVNAGIDGQGDITGVLPVQRTPGSMPYGIRIEIEVKAGKDRLSDQQKSFGSFMINAGACYIVARSVEQCLEDLGRWA